MLSRDSESQNPGGEFTLHRLSWLDFDDLARSRGGVAVVKRLWRADRSRRLLLLRALADEFAKSPELFGPLPSPDIAWELLARIEEKSPDTFDLMLAHPYTGSWAGYTMRLLRGRIAGVCPLWMHVGHIHALAAAAAIRAGIEFDTAVPLWNGGAILPTLGLLRISTDSQWSVAEVRGRGGWVEVSSEAAEIRLPRPFNEDTSDWWCIRQFAPRSGTRTLTIRLDDLDPYRGLYEPVQPDRLKLDEADAWREALAEAWHLIACRIPDLADAFPVTLYSLVPLPTVPFRMPSASTGEAFGSALVAKPQDTASLAAMLVHEFQHIRLGGLLQLIRLYEEDDRERFYVPWRDDPRPIGGVLQGVYAFFGVTMLWRQVANAESQSFGRRSAFEFAYWRRATWRALRQLLADPGLTDAGHRFVSGVAERLGPWQHELLRTDVAAAAEAATADHYAGWRMRYLRPNPELIAMLAEAWVSGRARPALARHELTRLMTDQPPTPVPDGTWSKARTDLLRLTLTDTDSQHRRVRSAEVWQSVPDVTSADFAYVTGRSTDAIRGYRRELAQDPDRPASWVGLGLALSLSGTGHATRTLLRYPELVRAVHREIRSSGANIPNPDDLAAWIGQVMR